VRLDGRPVLRVGPAPDATAPERARRIEQRLQRILETPGAVGAAQVRSANGHRPITVSGVPVLAVRPRDAEENGVEVDALAARWSQALDVALARAAQERSSGWTRFAAEVQGSVRGAFSRLAESAIRIVPRAFAAVLVIGFFWLLASAARALMRAVFRRVVNDLTVENLIKQIAYYSIWLLGLIVAVDALGFEPQTVVAGLGLTGLALGFALKDILSNFVSGLLLLLLRPFQLGDQIVVGETEGAVERIRLRATDIRTYDGRLVLVPNSEIFTSRVTNNTASPVRRAGVELHLDYSTDLPRAVEILREAVASTEGVLPEPPVAVRVSALGTNDLSLELRFWTDSRRSDYVATQAAVSAAAVAALRQGGIPLPDPDQRALLLREPELWRSVLKQ
jgi:small-conductance mechanosensitive channel